MRHVLFLGFLLVCTSIRAQYVYTIKADSVKITGASCDSAELIIQNHTQGVTGGFLYNTGSGRTIFQKVLQKINDSTYLVGVDSLKVVSPSVLSTGISGYNVDFLYGNGNTGIPIKGGDSSYTDAHLVGRHLVVYFNGPYSSTFVQDSITWTLLGANPTIPYYRFNNSLGRVTFCNMQNVNSLSNTKFVVSIFGGDQGYYATVVSSGSTPSPTLTVTPTSLSAFVTTAGTQSTSQSFVANGSSLTGNVTVTAPTGFVVSLNNSTFSGAVTITESGGTIPATTVYVAVASSASTGTVSGNVAVTSAGASGASVAVSGTVNAPASLVASPTSLTGFSTSQGIQSNSQTFTITAAGLTSAATVTAPSGYVVSLSSGSGYSGSLTVPESGGAISGVTVYVAIASTAPTGTASGSVVVSSPSVAATAVAVSGTVNATAALDSIRVQFTDSLHKMEQSGWTYMIGDIGHTDSITAVGGNSHSIHITALKSNWNIFIQPNAPHDYTCSDSIYSALSTNTILPYAPNVASSLWYTYANTYSASQPQLQIYGLLPGHTYNLEISASCNAAFFNDVTNSTTSLYRAGSATGTIMTQGSTSDMYSQSAGQPNFSNIATFSGSLALTADPTGSIYIWMTPPDNQSAAGASWLILTQAS